MNVEQDWQRLEEVMTRAVLKARSEEMRDVAEAVKLLASYMREGFESTPRSSRSTASGWRS